MFRKSIKYLFKTKGTNNTFDFSIFLPNAPQTHKQQLFEECTKRGISIYDDNPLEQSSGVYSIFRNPASEAELEDRLMRKKANDIQILILVATIISLANSFF